jgi:hypothetical protein
MITRILIRHLLLENSLDIIFKAIGVNFNLKRRLVSDLLATNISAFRNRDIRAHSKSNPIFNGIYRIGHRHDSSGIHYIASYLSPHYIEYMRLSRAGYLSNLRLSHSNSIWPADMEYVFI